MAEEKHKKERNGVREVRALTTDERASFVIFSLYLFTFCLASFIYFEWLVLRVVGVTAASAGLFLFYAAFFNTEGRGNRNQSQHPVRTYLLSFFLVLLTLFLLRFVGGLIVDPKIAVITLYAGLALFLIIFRKAMIQVVSMLAISVFIFVTVHNWDRALSGNMTIKDAFEQCGQAMFRIGPIQDVANMLIAGNYVHYLNKVDYRNEQINILATRLVLDTDDDELRKTRALLDFVSHHIKYVSDPLDDVEFAKDPITTLIAGGGDCEDQALILCSLMESVGLKTYIAFTDDHVFALVRFSKRYDDLTVDPFVYLDGVPCYALDPADPEAQVGFSLASKFRIQHVFDVRKKMRAPFELYPED